jgi:tRNA G18 (ribose-2'-O)-methylase SpoU
MKVIGAALEDSSIDLKELDLSKPTILVLGNEGHGVRTNILKRCDSLVKIRGRGVCTDATVASSNDGAMVDSLNVSVSGAILLHYILCNGRY